MSENKSHHNDSTLDLSSKTSNCLLLEAIFHTFASKGRQLIRIYKQNDVIGEIQGGPKLLILSLTKWKKSQEPKINTTLHEYTAQHLCQCTIQSQLYA